MFNIDTRHFNRKILCNSTYGKILNINCTKKGAIIAGTSNHLIIVWPLTGSEFILSDSEKSSILIIGKSTNDDIIVSYAATNQVTVWDLPNKIIIKKFNIAVLDNLHMININLLLNNKIITAMYNSGTVVMYDIRTGNIINTFEYIKEDKKKIRDGCVTQITVSDLSTKLNIN